MCGMTIENIPIAYIECSIIVDKKGALIDIKCLNCNTEFARLIKESRESIIGKNLGEIFCFEENVCQIENMGIESGLMGKDKAIEYHNMKDGKLYRILFRSYKKNIFVAFFIDITDSVNFDRKLDIENKKLKEIVEGTKTGIWEWDMVNGVNIVNENWANIIGYSAEELGPITHERWRSFIHPDDIEKNDELIESHIRGESKYYITEFRIRHREGYWVWVLERGKVISYTEDGLPEMMIGTHVDVTDKKHRQDEIEYLSYHDQLTGLYNRRYFEETIKRIDKEENLPISLIVADLNGLKLTNDAFGHQVGDELIKRAADILKFNSREEDIVARIGGDEFAIILPKTNGVNANKINRRYCEIISNTKLNPVSVSLAMGFATKYDMEEGIINTFIEAEQSMYNRKVRESMSVKEDNLENIIENFFKEDCFKKNHSESVSNTSELLGRAIGLEDTELEHLKLSGLLHDIGSMGAKKSTFGDVTDMDEYSAREMKRHPEVGYQILRSVNRMVPIAEYVLHHHERWDGKGYPLGLKGVEIPIQSRIISLADSYDMLRRFEGRSEDEALKRIRENSGTRFDPDLVEIFLKQLKGI